MGLYDDMEQVLLSQQQIREKVEELGVQISQDYAGKEPVLVSVLKGAFMLYGRSVPGHHHPLFHGLYGRIQLWGWNRKLRPRANN